MAAASAKKFGRFNMTVLKGLRVDIPYACAEGFRAVPKLYGEEVKDHGDVKDWSSGFEVAGKNFANGMVDGVTGLWTKPYEEGKSDGALGVAKGVGKGLLGFGSKVASASLGLVAYPGQGICKSIRHAAEPQTRGKIKASKMKEGEHPSLVIKLTSYPPCTIGYRHRKLMPFVTAFHSLDRSWKCSRTDLPCQF